MDPDEALRNARTAASLLTDDPLDGPLPEKLRTAAMEQLVESFQALDGWLSQRGFLPEAWKR